jgi:hypothetical protein
MPALSRVDRVEDETFVWTDLADCLSRARASFLDPGHQFISDYSLFSLLGCLPLLLLLLSLLLLLPSPPYLLPMSWHPLSHTHSKMFIGGLNWETTDGKLVCCRYTSYKIYKSPAWCRLWRTHWLFCCTRQKRENTTIGVNPPRAAQLLTGSPFISIIVRNIVIASLSDYFSRFGELSECMVMKDPVTSKSRGFGFLTFVDAKNVDAVLKEDHHLDGKMVKQQQTLFPHGQHYHSFLFLTLYLAWMTFRLILSGLSLVKSKKRRRRSLSEELHRRSRRRSLQTTFRSLGMCWMPPSCWTAILVARADLALSLLSRTEESKPH